MRKTELPKSASTTVDSSKVGAIKCLYPIGKIPVDTIESMTALTLTLQGKSHPFFASGAEPVQPSKRTSIRRPLLVQNLDDLISELSTNQRVGEQANSGKDASLADEDTASKSSQHTM